MFSRKGRNGEKGQGLVEYALILVLVAIVVIVILATMGPAIAGVYCSVIGELSPGGSCQGGGGDQLFDNYDALLQSCDAANGHEGPSGPATGDLQTQGYIHYHNCLNDSDNSLLWVGYHK